MKDEELKKIIETAKEKAEQNFLRFVKGIYKGNENEELNESVFEHLWKVPVIDSFQGDKLIEPLEDEKDYDELLDKVDVFIDGELGDEDACFIYLDKMEGEFEDEEEELKSQWKDRVKDDGGAVIVYNGTKLKRMYEEFVIENKKSKNPKTKEELDKIFLNYLTTVIQHERCHLNASTLEIHSDYPRDYIIYKGNEEHTDDAVYVNGGEASSYEIDSFIEENDGIGNLPVDYLKNYENRNEVLVDTLAQMMNYYQDGYSIEDCLYKIISKRNGKSQYDDFDDKVVLSLYVMFPEEITEWAIFGAYSDFRENKLKEKMKTVFGDDSKEITGSQFKEKISKYIKGKDLSERQLEMLKKLGVTPEREFNPVDIGLTSTKSVSFKDLVKARFKIKDQIKDQDKSKKVSGRETDGK